MAGRFLSVTIGTVSDVPASEVVVDGIGAADAVAASLAGVRSATDAAQATDAVVAVLAAARAVVDAVGLADAVSASLTGGNAVIPATIPFTIGA